MAVKTLNILQPTRGLSKVMGIPKSSRPCTSPKCSGTMVGALLGLPSGVKLRFFCETCKTSFLPGSGLAKIDSRIAEVISNLETEDKAIAEMADKLRQPASERLGDMCLCGHVRRGHYVVLTSVTKDGCSQCSCGGFRLAEPTEGAVNAAEADIREVATGEN